MAVIFTKMLFCFALTLLSIPTTFAAPMEIPYGFASEVKIASKGANLEHEIEKSLMGAISESAPKQVRKVSNADRSAFALQPATFTHDVETGSMIRKIRKPRSARLEYGLPQASAGFEHDIETGLMGVIPEPTHREIRQANEPGATTAEQFVRISRPSANGFTQSRRMRTGKPFDI